MIPLGLIAAASAALQEIITNSWFGNNNIDNFKQTNERYHENS